MSLKEEQLAKEIENNFRKVHQDGMSNLNLELAKDYAGALIKKDQYNKKTEYGWVIMHIVPQSATAHYEHDLNKCPVHWKNAEAKGNDFPEWKTVLSTNDNITNIKIEKKWRCINGLIRKN